MLIFGWTIRSNYSNEILTFDLFADSTSWASPHWASFDVRWLRSGIQSYSSQLQAVLGFLWRTLKDKQNVSCKTTWGLRNQARHISGILTNYQGEKFALSIVNSVLINAFTGTFKSSSFLLANKLNPRNPLENFHNLYG